jgi:hypothetical protein
MCHTAAAAPCSSTATTSLALALHYTPARTCIARKQVKMIVYDGIGTRDGVDAATICGIVRRALQHASL